MPSGATPNDPSAVSPREGASGLSGWRIARVTGAFPTAVSFWLERGDGGAKIQILVRQRGEGQCLQSTPLGDVSYRQVTGLNDSEAAQVTRAFAKALERGSIPVARHFPHLAAEAGLDDDGARLRLAQVMEPAIALLGDRQHEFADLPDRPLPAVLTFDPPGIAEFLAPEIEVDGPAMLGWVFRGVYLPSVARRQSADFSAYVLEFTREAGEETVQLALRADGDQSKAFGRCGRLSLGISHQGDVDAVPVEIASLASWVVALLRLKSSSALDLRVPQSMAELRAISYPARSDAIETVRDGSAAGAPAVAAASGPPPALNLALDPDCGQRCVFCSVKSYVTPTDAGAADVDDVRMQLEKARQRGVREVRLNGIDPLQHSRVLEVVETIRGMGFPALTVFSTGRRLADAAFRSEFLRRAPSQLKVFVPLYGRTAATHDSVTGTPGSHAEVLAAIAGLRADTSSDVVQISTILVKQNVHEIVPMLRWLREIGLGMQVGAHLPYPMKPTMRDPYVDAALRETELLDRLLADLQPLPADERSWALAVITGAFRHPCVRWQAERRSGLAVLGGSFPEVAFPLAGTEYRSASFVHASGTAGEGDAFAVAVVECPHVAECALASVCPREHYGVYAERYGLDEYSPVRPAELYGAAPAGRRSSWGRGAGSAPSEQGRSRPGGGVWNAVKDAWRSR